MNFSDEQKRFIKEVMEPMDKLTRIEVTDRQQSQPGPLKFSMTVGVTGNTADFDSAFPSSNLGPSDL